MITNVNNSYGWLSLSWDCRPWFFFIDAYSRTVRVGEEVIVPLAKPPIYDAKPPIYDSKSVVYDSKSVVYDSKPLV